MTPVTEWRRCPGMSGSGQYINLGSSQIDCEVWYLDLRVSEKAGKQSQVEEAYKVRTSTTAYVLCECTWAETALAIDASKR